MICKRYSRKNVANLVGLQENVLARLPNIETIRRDVRRNRPNNHPAVPDIYDTYTVFHTTELHCGRLRSPAPCV